MVTGPVTLLPTACTEPVSGGGSEPVVPVIVTGPVTRLALNSTPALLFVSVTEPVIVFPAHGPVAASPPIRTRPVLSRIATGPVSVDPQTATTPAPEALTGPVKVAPSA